MDGHYLLFTVGQSFFFAFHMLLRYLVVTVTFGYEVTKINHGTIALWLIMKI